MGLTIEKILAAQQLLNGIDVPNEDRLMHVLYWHHKKKRFRKKYNHHLRELGYRGTDWSRFLISDCVVELSI